MNATWFVLHSQHACLPACLQSCMYREMDAEKRSKDLAALAFQLDVLNMLIKGPYVNGAGPCPIAPLHDGVATLHRPQSPSFLRVLIATRRYGDALPLSRSMLQHVQVPRWAWQMQHCSPH